MVDIQLNEHDSVDNVDAYFLKFAVDGKTVLEETSVAVDLLDSFDIDG